MKIPYVDISAQYCSIKYEILKEVEDVLASGQVILGEVVNNFEESFAALCHTKYAVGVANGTDALMLSMKALGIGEGDEVLTVPNSFIATASSIVLVGAQPVFVDVGDDFNIDPDKIERAITSKTKAIIPVHLTGRPADLNPILNIANKYGLSVIEDAAQAARAEYEKQRVGSFGATGCFSFHPLKNFNAFGDGGAITTNDIKLYQKLLKLRNHGLRNRDECEFWGYNSRLDAIQAAILNVKLKYLEKWVNRRRKIAFIYQEQLKQLVHVPVDKPFEKAVYHTFIIQADDRDELQKYLAKKGVNTKIHYPIPIHLQNSAMGLGYKKGDFPHVEKQSLRILSIPVYPELSDEQIEYIINSIKAFYAG